MSYSQIVTALADSLADERLREAPSRSGNEFVAAEVIRQQRRMPDYLHLPITLLTWLFNFSGLLHQGRLFHRANADQRARQIEAWRQSRIGPCRGFVRFYESLVLLIALSGDES